jgi:methylmalonyl-CoA/ethylmalonyl-CoA epimerase
MSRIRFDHIAIGTHRLADAAPFLAGELGGRPDRGRPSTGFRWATWRFAGGGCVEILEPLGSDGFLHRFLAHRGPGVHHVTFEVPSLADVCRRAEGHGYTIVGRDDSDPAWQEAFLHPKEALGIVVQFAQPGPEKDAQRPGEAPAGVDDPPPPVTLVGLRMRAHSRERARRQWQEVCGGECAAGADGALVFRWPGSAMRIAVNVDPAGAEGPIAIEVAGDRTLALPAGPHPLLGVAFVEEATRPAPR